MPGQPEPKMHVQREVSQVRSQRNTSESSAGLANSTHWRGNPRSTSGICPAYARPSRARGWENGHMRMGVLDIGSTTGHLLIVDAYRGGPPIPAHSFKESLRLSEHLDDTGAVNAEGISRLVKYVVEARAEAEDNGCTKVLAFATSAVRDAVNADDVLAAVRAASEIDVEVLPGDDEARLTFLAVRRWFGWSSGRLGVFDIGGGSLEIAVGSDEQPDVAQSLPLGAGRLTREWFEQGKSNAELRRHVRSVIAEDAGAILRGGAFDHAVAT